MPFCTHILVPKYPFSTFLKNGSWTKCVFHPIWGVIGTQYFAEKHKISTCGNASQVEYAHLFSTYLEVPFGTGYLFLEMPFSACWNESVVKCMLLCDSINMLVFWKKHQIFNDWCIPTNGIKVFLYSLCCDTSNKYLVPKYPISTNWNEWKTEGFEPGLRCHLGLNVWTQIL